MINGILQLELAHVLVSMTGFCCEGKLTPIRQILVLEKMSTG